MGILQTLLSAPKTAGRPIFTSANCINRRQRKVSCSVCHELCPEKVFSMDPAKPLAWDRCTNCGMCVSACPSRCFAPDAQLQKLYTQELNLSAPVSFSCEKELQLCDKVVCCLAGIPWELFAVIALYTDVVIYVGACDACPHTARIEQLRGSMEKLYDFLGEEKFAERVHILKKGSFSPAAAAVSEKSRREVFQDARKSVAKGFYKLAASRLPFLDEINSDGLQYRELLNKAILNVRAQAQNSSVPSLPRFGTCVPKFTEKCFGCSICERMCPQKALEFGPLENGKRRVFLKPWKCTACGLCAAACPYGGIAGMETLPLPYWEKLALVDISSAKCEKCGISIRPNEPTGMCNACRAKQKKHL